jgi:hypothetical protein
MIEVNPQEGKAVVGHETSAFATNAIRYDRPLLSLEKFKEEALDSRLA